MDEFSIVRSMALRIGERTRAGSALDKALGDWLTAEDDWLQLGCAGDALLAERLAALCTCSQSRDPGEDPSSLTTARAIAALLDMDARETALFEITVARERLGRVRSLAAIAAQGRIGPCEAISFALDAAPTDSFGLFRGSTMVRLGLVDLGNDGEAPVPALNWRFSRLLDTVEPSEPALLKALGGPIASTPLTLEDFRHVEDAPLMRGLLAGASAQSTHGVHLLIHGPPGTGKTELAKALAASAGLTLHAVGEADIDGDEPNRFERLSALSVALRIARRRPRTALLFDELEDTTTEGDGKGRRTGSKVWINRLLEHSPVPVIWTSNRIDNVDPAHLRRMSFVMKLDFPPVSAARRMLARIAVEEGVEVNDSLVRLAERVPETASVFRPAVRAARLAPDRGFEAAERTARALVKALGCDPEMEGSGLIEASLFESDWPIAATIDRIVASGCDDVSLLLTGPPGTGKTALAHELARAMDRPLLTKRTSDLLSKWVGETEKAIAETFAEARSRGSILLFDEVDSLLRDRSLAANGWEVGQVNELLTWLDRHPLPVVAATNHVDRLDPAAMRRFAFKIELGPLGPEKCRSAFAHFFGVEAPRDLDRLHGLTPGDFAVVARRRRLLGLAGPDGLIEELELELNAKPCVAGRLGF